MPDTRVAPDQINHPKAAFIEASPGAEPKASFLPGHWAF